MSKLEEMKLSMKVVNGQSKVPPGFRFHPTEEELLQYYLMKKVACEKIDPDVIQEVDLNKLEPWEIQEKCNIGSNPQNDCYFYSHKDKKYPTGTRTNRSTAAGFWKATGRDKVILQRTGMRKTLVFYKGRAPHGQKSDWIMHEYRLDDTLIPMQDSEASNLRDSSHEEGWVICRLFKKKNYHKSLETPQRSLTGSMDTRPQLQSSNTDGILNELLMCMDGKSCMQETENFTTIHDTMQQLMNPINDTFIHLPGLDSPMMTRSPRIISSTSIDQGSSVCKKDCYSMCEDYDQYSNWVDVDKIVASQLDDRMEGTKNFSSCYEESDGKFCFTMDRNEPVLVRSEEDLWDLARSPVDPLYH
ncbi:hypothetical protein R6Q59_003970 [Mikania micrantha]